MIEATARPVTVLLFEFDHGLTCAGCGREVHKGQPYASRPDSVREDGALFSDLLCVYCAFPPESAPARTPSPDTPPTPRP